MPFLSKVVTNSNRVNTCGFSLSILFLLESDEILLPLLQVELAQALRSAHVERLTIHIRIISVTATCASYLKVYPRRRLSKTSLVGLVPDQIRIDRSRIIFKLVFCLFQAYCLNLSRRLTPIRQILATFTPPTRLSWHR